MRKRRLVLTGAAIVTLLVAGLASGAPAVALARDVFTDLAAPAETAALAGVVEGAPGSFVSLEPTRVLDTRSGNGATGVVGANRTIAVQVAGRAGVPSSGVSAVVLNVTVTESRASGFVTVFPDGTQQPVASNLNFPAGDTRPNMVTVKLGGNGKVALNNWSAGSVHLIADIAGYYLNGWSAPELIAPYSGDLQALSCSTTSFCVAGDYWGNVLTYDGTSWSAPTPITGPFSPIASISCAGPIFCALLDERGNAAVWNGATWSVPKQLFPSGRGAVSCPTVTFCAALGADGQSAFFDGSTWSAAAPHDPVAHEGLSCPTTSFCVAVSGRETSIFDGDSWSTDINVFVRPEGGSVQSISCPTTTFCATVTSQGDVFTFDGQSWSYTFHVSTMGGVPWAISCASANFCVGGNGWSAVQFDGSQWSEKWSGVGSAGLSCVTTTFCVAVERASGSAWIFDGTRWSQPSSIDPRRVGLSAVACPTPDFCAAADESGHTFTFDGTSWSGRTAFELNPWSNITPHPLAIDCATKAFCVAVGLQGMISTFDGVRWSMPWHALSMPGFRDVSCPTVTFCMAVDQAGGAYTYNGTELSERIQIRRDEYPHMAGVSCVTEAFCVAVSRWGTVTTWDGSSWSYPVALAGEPTPQTDKGVAVSCLSLSFCAVVISNGDTFVFDGTAWLPSTSLGKQVGSVEVSCVTPQYCLAVSAEGQAFSFDGVAWSHSGRVADNVWGWADVDCPSVAFCAAVFSSGHVTIGRPPS